MRHLAAALPLLLGGCLQIAVLGEPGGAVASSTGRSVTSTSGGASTSGTATSGGSNGTGTTTGRASTGTTTGTICGACAPGASCVANYCQCPNGQDCPNSPRSYCDPDGCLNCLGSFVGNSCLTKIVASPDPGCVAVNSTWIFWIDQHGINRLPISGDGGKNPTILLPGPLGIGCLTADEERVYYTNDAEGDGVVRSILVDGGSDTPDGGPLATGQGTAYGIFVDDTYVYWTSSTLDQVLRADKADGFNPFILNDAGASVSGPYGIVADATNVYWTNALNGQVQKAPIQGGRATIVASNEGNPRGIAIQDGDLYWVDYIGNAVKKAPVTGVPDGGAATPKLGATTEPTSIATDSQYVYWTSAGGVSRLLLDGGSRTSLFPYQATHIAVDAKRVYWTSPAALSGGVYVLSPK